MKHLFFVSVAFSLLTGTSISGNAQTAVNSVKVTVQQKKSEKFIDGIEIKREAQVIEETDLWAVPIKKTSPVIIKNSTKKSVSNETISVIESYTISQFKYAQLLDIDVELITNNKLYNFIDDWWATRYRYGGTTKNGIDCSAFTETLMNEAYGLILQRTAKGQFKQCNKIAKENLQEGDLVFFNTRGGVSHVGVFLGNNYFVHSSVHAGVTINSLNDDYYDRKYIGGGRVKMD
jgi:lipoprotein Spr